MMALPQRQTQFWHFEYWQAACENSNGHPHVSVLTSSQSRQGAGNQRGRQCDTKSHAKANMSIVG
jgi:hypothetical protein